MCRCDTPAPFVPGRQVATSRPPDKAVPAPVRRPVRARLCGCALGRVRLYTCASGQAQGTPPPRGVHFGGAACTLRRDGVASRSDGDRLFPRPRAALSRGARGAVPQEGRNARKSQKNGQCGQMAAHAARRTSRTGANGACRPRPTRDTCARARHAPLKKTRNYLALSRFMSIFAVHKSAAARGGSPPLDSRNAPPLAFMPPSRRRAERGAVLKAYNMFFIRNIVFVV